MPLSRIISLPRDITVHVWEQSESVDEMLALCRHSGIDTSAAERVKSQQRRAEMLAEALLVRDVLGNVSRLTHDDVGRPIDKLHAFHLSISHTRGMVVIAVGERQAVGVDVEYRSDRVLRVRRRFLNEREQPTFADDDADACLTAWTAKEAIYKAAHVVGMNYRDDLQLAPPIAFAGGRWLVEATYFDRHFEAETIDLGTHLLTTAWETTDNN